MPLVLLLRTIPLVSIAPVIILNTGRGTGPSLFAAARVSVPGAVTGALLAEWLSTGQGIGGAILKFNAQAQFTQLWASIALITLLLYNIVQIVENIVLVRMGMAPSQR